MNSHIKIVCIFRFCIEANVNHVQNLGHVLKKSTLYNSVYELLLPIAAFEIVNSKMEIKSHNFGVLYHHLGNLAITIKYLQI